MSREIIPESFRKWHNAPKGMVFDIRRCSFHDGPGVRTTVFLKGCPLNCLWCHNPESKRRAAEIRFFESRCALCGKCADICEHGGHAVLDGRHDVDRVRCVVCGQCVSACPHDALQLVGREYTVEEIMEIVRRDRAYYEKSGGGLTVSGGEPLCQPEFTQALLLSAQQERIHTALDTSGFADGSVMQMVARAVDLFLYDIKETDPLRHEKFTGVSNERILENLRKLDRQGAAIILRCPIVPGFNDRDDHLQRIAALADGLKHVREINLLAYHAYAEGKSEQIGETWPLRDVPSMTPETLAHWTEKLRRMTSKTVKN